MAPTVPVYTTEDARYLTDFWGLFEETPVSSTNINVVARTMEDGVAVLRVSPTGAAGASDRRLFLLDPTFTATDVEAYITYEIFGGAPAVQGGVVLRVSPGGSGLVAPIVWQNIFFGATGNLIPGAWEFSGAALTQTNQQADPANGSFTGYPRAIDSLTGDGTTVTVTMAEPHLLEETQNFGVAIRDNALFPGSPFVFGTVIDPFTFTFPSTTAGTEAGGRITWTFWVGRRHLAARLVGDQLTGKQWPPTAPEPAWDDPLKAGTVTLPDPLAGGVPLPSGPGRAGFVFAHVEDVGHMDVYQFEVNSLD